MRNTVLIGILLLNLTTYVAAAAESNVIPLSIATFDQETKDHVWFVKFYAPWCGHCKKLAPILDQMSIDPQVVSTDLRIGKVDCTTEQSICERFSIQGYPTLKVVVKGRYYDYEGSRDVPSMIAFAHTGYKDAHAEQVPTQADLEAFKEHLAAEQAEMEQSSPVQSLTSATFEEQVIQSNHPWMLKFYAPWCGHCKRLAPTWHRLSKTLKESKSTTLVGKIDCTVHRRICSRFDVNGYPTLLYIRNGTVYKYQNARNLNAFIEFVESGWANAPSLGPIPNETFWSGLVDHAMEWAGENTALAIVAGILLIAIIVALLVALLDYCMAEDDLSAYRPVPRPADDNDGEQTPASTGTKPTVDKPKAE